MYKARRYETDGTEAGDRELPIWLFDGIVNEHVLHQAVRAYLLNQRQGSASAKTRSEMRGGGRKPWRQKGTGRARHGSIRSPIWEGGGVTFPPKPKSWRVDLPKKVKRLAKRSALNARAEDGRVLVVGELDFEEPKTKRLRVILESLEVSDGKVLLLTNGVKETVYLSGRNMPHVKVMPFGQEAAYDVLWAAAVVIEETALESAAEKAEAEDLEEKARERIARTEAKAELEAELAAGEEPAEAEEEAPGEAAEPDEPEAEATPEPEEAEADDGSAAEAPDVEDIELPTVKELADFLADFDDVATIRALQERDDRKTAQKHYDDRVEELAGGEEDDG